MCLLCIEINRDRITLKETFTAMNELVVPEDHKTELIQVIEDKFGQDNVIDMLWTKYYYEGSD